MNSGQAKPAVVLLSEQYVSDAVADVYAYAQKVATRLQLPEARESHNRDLLEAIERWFYAGRGFERDATEDATGDESPAP